MISTLTRLAIVAALAASLSGCIMYVSPDHHATFHHTKTAPDEKPAETVDKTAI